MTLAERGIWLDDATHREDLATFTERALRLDDAAVIRLRERQGRLVVAWVATGFDVLASRVVGGRIRPADLSAGADALAAGLTAMDRNGYVEPGFPMDSAWRGALPPESGFVHLDDVPARVCSIWRSGVSRWPRNIRARMGRLRRCWTKRWWPCTQATSVSASRCAAYSL